jgi:hypothetical protein
MMSRRAIMTALVTLPILVGGCVAPPVREYTAVTFHFETWDTKLRLIAGYEVEVTVTVSGFAPLTASGKTGLDYPVSSAKYPEAAKQIDAEATVQGAPSGTLLTCSWTAVTPAGTRSSERSRGGEGSAAVPPNGTSTTVACQYQA